MALAKIQLRGELADMFASEIEANVACVRDAVDALEANFPGIRPYLLNSGDRGIFFHVRAGILELDETQIYLPTGSQTIVITPVIAASGSFGKIIAGVALLGLGLTGVGFLGISASTLALTGGVMILQGVLGLFNKPKAEAESEEKKTSLVFNGPVNTTAAGGVVPVVFGELIVGSQVISAWISVKTVVDDD
jgi:predicted phage tail protein